MEKRFRLTSKQTGTILSGNDISQVILSILVGYFGNYGHRPHWMSIAVILGAGSGFAAALPHFIYGPGKDAIRIAEFTSRSASALISNITRVTSKEKRQELCHLQPDLNCEDEDMAAESFIGPVILLFISQFCVGITVTTFYSIGVTYLDDNISKKSYPIYYAFTFMLRILGPVTGFFMGGKCLSMWIDPQKQPNLTRKDPRWYGAWWIGYLFIGCNLLLAGSLLMLFPRKLPATLRRESKKVLRQAEKDEQAGAKRGIEYFASLAKTKQTEREKPTFKNLLRALRRIFTNKIWVGNLFNTVVYVLAASGYWNFKPKYLENQFRKSTSESSYYTGVTSLVSLMLGTGLGGAVLRWAQPGPRFVTGYNIFITLLQSCSYVVLMFVGCPKVDVVGPVEGLEGPPCSADCGCSDRYSPICSEDKTTLFYSPCYAGCTVANTSASPIVYSDCHCITNGTDPFNKTFIGDTVSPDSATFGYATSGYCEEPCNAFIYYIIIQTVVKTVASTGRVGSNLIHIRSVADEDKGIALGTLTVCLSLFGFIPAPIMMGAIVDSACLIWDKTCGKFGNCWLYDSDKFRIIIHMVPAVLIFISVFGDIVVYYYSRQLDLYGIAEEEIDLEQTKNKEEEEEEEQEEEEEEEEKTPLKTEEEKIKKEKPEDLDSC
ncbi:hypothetical protein SK128_004077 [Halocaridina rubra]|uniref:Solute carrier organic anion transporter family member n=1 Tax=Halocaridina rubra TaxID=373956 RepID=A0AAN9A2V1_HALRR